MNTPIPTSSLPCNLTITASIDADCNEDADALFKRLHALLRDSGLDIAPRQMWLELPWRSDAPVDWAHSCEPAVLSETFATTLQAIANNRNACHVTAQVLSRVLALPTISFAVLERVVDMQRDIQQRAIDLDRLADNLKQVAMARHIPLPEYTPDETLLDLARNGAFARVSGAWVARPDLDMSQVMDAAGEITDVPDDELDACGLPPIQLIEATFSQTYICPEHAPQCTHA